MRMIRHAADAETFAIRIPGHGGQLGVKSRPHGGLQHRGTVFGAKDDVGQQIGQGLGHGNEHGGRWIAAAGIGLSALLGLGTTVPGALPQAGMGARLWRWELGHGGVFGAGIGGHHSPPVWKTYRARKRPLRTELGKS